MSDDFDVNDLVEASEEEDNNDSQQSNKSPTIDYSAVLTDVAAVSRATWEQLREFQAAYGKSVKRSADSPYAGAAIEAKIHQIRMGGETFHPVPWIEHLTITASGPTLEESLGDNKEDEFARESGFVQQALDAATKGYEHLEELGVPYLRPDDYYAEMLKTDLHMAKIRRNLLHQQKKIEVVEERRKRREMKKFGKQVQVEKQQQRDVQKKREQETLKKWRKQGKNDPSVSDDQFLVSLEESAASSQPKANPKKRAQPSQAPLSYKKQQEMKKPNPKRQRKNEKYGFGGQKRGSKSNDKKSFNDVRSFNKKKNNAIPHDLKNKMPNSFKNKRK